jgi:hypothetical protein
MMAGLAVALATFALYWATLLPGQDLGDTASFQVLVSTSVLTPRDAYPLYFMLGKALVAALAPAEPARALNVMSAVFGALACGALVPLGRRLSGSTLSGVFSALLLGASYTFWSQALIAEVYTLEVFFIAVSIGAAIWWVDRPSLARLALFMAVYAISFGNHLSMILLMPGLTLLVLGAYPGGWREAVRPRVLLLAMAVVMVGAAPYAWNLATLMASPEAPGTLGEAARAFWFDVTKSDWRSSMMGQVPEARLGERLAMYWFDVRQQFGVLGFLLAGTGAVALARSWRLGAAALLAIYGVAGCFAFTYNVGDTHVFFLPSHTVVALLTAPGAAAVLGRVRSIPIRTVLLAGSLVYPAARAADAYPAIDRRDDTRAPDLCRAVLQGTTEGGDILALDVNWQLYNGLAYYTLNHRVGVPMAPLAPMLLSFPDLVEANRDVGRWILVAPESGAELVRAAYGGLYSVHPDSRLDRPSLRARVESARPGTLYVLSYLRSSAAPVALEELQAASLGLAGTRMPDARFNVLVGRVGTPPLLKRSSDRPFRVRIDVPGTPALTVRMESWLPFDTIRRAGFGHVTSGVRHVFTLELGISLALLGDAGAPLTTYYEGGAFAVPARFLVSPAGRE